MQMVEADTGQQCGPQAHQQACPHDGPTRQAAGRESDPDWDEYGVALGQKGGNRTFGVGQTVHLENEPQRAKDPDAQSLFPFQGSGADGESGPGTVWIAPSPLATDSIADHEQHRGASETAGHQQGGQKQAGIPRCVALPQLLNGFEQRKTEGPEGTSADQDQRGDDTGIHQKRNAALWRRLVKFWLRGFLLLGGHRGVVGHPAHVQQGLRIAGRDHATERDVVAGRVEVDLGLADLGAEPAADLGVAIGEGKASGSVVVVGRLVHHLGTSSSARIGHDVGERRVIDAVGMLVDQHPGLGRLDHGPELVVLTPLRLVGVVVVIEPVAVAPDLTHRVAADARHLELADADHLAVGRALEDRLGAAYVLEERAVGEVPLVGAVGRVVDVALDPVRAAIASILSRHGSVRIVIGVQAPSEHELLEVVHAQDAGGLGLGLGQSRQEHSGEDRDDCDDHQQFDQRKAAPDGTACRKFQVHLKN